MPKAVSLTFTYGSEQDGFTEVSSRQVLSDNQNAQEDILAVSKNYIKLLTHLGLKPIDMLDIFHDAVFTYTNFDYDEELEEGEAEVDPTQRKTVNDYLGELHKETESAESMKEALSDPKVVDFQKQVAANKLLAKKVLKVFLESLKG